MNAALFVIVPPRVVTATLCAPAMPAGVTAVIFIALTTTTFVAATPSIVTLLAPAKLVPMMVMAVPPKVVPLVGLTVVMVAEDGMYVKAFVSVVVPPWLVTDTFCAPWVPIGVIAVMEVALTTTTLVAAAPPTFTLVTPVKLVPVMVMEVPPNVEPEFGLMEEMVEIWA